MGLNDEAQNIKSLSERNEKCQNFENFSNSKKLEEIRKNLSQRNPMSGLPPLSTLGGSALGFPAFSSHTKTVNKNAIDIQNLKKEKDIEEEKNKNVFCSNLNDKLSTTVTSVFSLKKNNSCDINNNKEVEKSNINVTYNNYHDKYNNQKEKEKDKENERNESEQIKKKKIEEEFLHSDANNNNNNNNSNDNDERNMHKFMQFINLIQDLLGYCEVLELSRQKTVEERNRIRKLNSEVSEMLKKSNEREQNIFLQTEKQRSFLVKHKQQFDSLKNHAEETVCTLAEQRDLLKMKLEKADMQLENLVIENEKLRKAQDLQKIEFQSIEGIKDAYALSLKEKQELQSEVENLRLENSKLCNEKNALQSEKTHLLSRLDTFEAERKSLTENFFNFDVLGKEGAQKSPMFSNNSGGEKSREQDDSGFAEISEEEIKIRLRAFRNLNLDEQFDHFKSLLYSFRELNARGHKYFEYANLLLHELDERRSGPNQTQQNNQI